MHHHLSSTDWWKHVSLMSLPASDKDSSSPGELLGQFLGWVPKYPELMFAILQFTPADEDALLCLRCSKVLRSGGLWPKRSLLSWQNVTFCPLWHYLWGFSSSHSCRGKFKNKCHLLKCCTFKMAFLTFCGGKSLTFSITWVSGWYLLVKEFGPVPLTLIRPWPAPQWN